ncbi:Concanavalin A-like lectin/glucanase superfamily, partial [Cynara cardunculus var. scolymus]
MRIHSSLWNADDWATRGGLVKTDWSKAPFTASYRNFNAEACVVAPGKPSSCGGGSILSYVSVFRFYVDEIPIREFRNDEAIGVPFPNSQPMRIHSSIWNADEWATRGGLVKTDWSRAPFTASYRSFSADACIWSSSRGSSCPSNSTKRGWFREKFNTAAVRKLKWAQKYHRVYNYCTDRWRFPAGPAPECKFI